MQELRLVIWTAFDTVILIIANKFCQWGRIRSMTDDCLRHVESASPSNVLRIHGLRGSVKPGDDILQVESEALAKDICHEREMHADISKLLTAELGSEGVLAADDKMRRLNLVVKCASDGSSTAVLESLKKLAVPDVHLSVVHSGAKMILA